MPDLRRDLAVEGPRAADDVWDRYVRPARWPEWSPQIRSVDYDPERLLPGTAGVVHGPLGLRVPFRVTEVDEPGMRWSWTACVAGVAGVALALDHSVEALPTGARTRLSVRGPAPVVAGYLPAAWLALHRLVR